MTWRDMVIMDEGALEAKGVQHLKSLERRWESRCQTPVPAVLKVVMELVPKEAQARTMERVRRLLGEALFPFPS